MSYQGDDGTWKDDPLHRSAGLIVAMFVMAVVLAAPASAHTVSGGGATNFKGVVTSITPPQPGLRAILVQNGAPIALTNTSPVEVTVLGYSSEPYLRIGPLGVFQNVNSPATYLNKTPRAAAVPTRLQGKAPLPAPVWERIALGHTARWHDHRTHWRSPLLPPGVRARPGAQQPVLDWQIELVRSGVLVTVNGTMVWVPSPSPWPWLGAATVLFAAVMLGARSRWWAPVLAAALGLVVVADVAHAVGVAFDYVGSLKPPPAARTRHELLLDLGVVTRALRSPAGVTAQYRRLVPGGLQRPGDGGVRRIR